MPTATVQRLSTDEAALSEWLAKLGGMNGIAASNEAYKFIVALKKEADKIDPAALRRAVMQITPLALYLSDFLEKTYLEKIAPRIAQLNTHLLRQLAALHSRCAETADIDQKIRHYNYALQMQGLVHYLRVLSYELPSSSLWAEMGMAYQAALDLQITVAVTDNLPPAMKKLNTIEKTAKRNLLFAACNAYRLSRPNIQALFRFCAEQHGYLELNKLGATSNEGFCWAYTEKQLPFPIKTLAEGRNGVIFNAEPLLKAQRQGTINWPITDFLPIQNALSNYKNLISSPSLALANNHVFISEYERVIEFFSSHIRSELAWIMNSPTPEHLNFSSLELLKDDQGKKERVSSEEIWGKPKEEKLTLASTDFGAIKTVKTDIPGFFVCEAIRAKLRDQDLLALYGNDLKPHLAIVRRLEPTKQAHMQKALIEILPGTTKTLTIGDGKTTTTALFSQHQDIRQLFIAPEKYATGSVLQTSAGPVMLERLIEATLHFQRYQVNLMPGKTENSEPEASAQP